MQVVYDFLADYFEEWDGIQYNRQIWQLLADVPFLPYPDLYENFLRVVERLFHSWDTVNRFTIIATCAQLIQNLVQCLEDI